MRLLAPASSANLGAGYDALSVALDGAFDSVEVRVEEGSGISVKVKGKYAGAVPEDPMRNSAGLAAASLLREAGLEGRIRVEIEVEKGIPVSSGLGSSGAAAAAAVCALNELLGLGMGPDELVRAAGRGEAASAGSEHYDNVAASLLGWFNVVRAGPGGVRAVNLRPPEGSRIFFGLSVPLGPPLEGKTGAARGLVPRSVEIERVVWNVASASMVVAGAALGDARLIGEGMADSIVEPARKALVPGYERARRAALGAGAYGVAISGAGPSMIAVSDDEGVARGAAEAMAEAMREEGAEAMALVSRPGPGCCRARRAGAST